MDRPIDQEGVIPSVSDRLRTAMDSLPVLCDKDIPLEESCPICLVSFSSIMTAQTEADSAEGIGLKGGVTKVEGCGHLFCRKDLLQWIESMHGSCPTCRHAFLDVTPPSDTDEESSDGEYFPESSEPDDDDGFSDQDADAFLDGEVYIRTPFDVPDVDSTTGEDEELDYWGEVDQSEEEDEGAFSDGDASESSVENHGDSDDIALDVEMVTRTCGSGTDVSDATNEVLVVAGEQTQGSGVEAGPNVTKETTGEK